MKLILTIPDAKTPRVVAAINGLYPIPTGPDGNPLFSPKGWAKEKLRLIVIDIVYKYEYELAESTSTRNITRENDLIT